MATIEERVNELYTRHQELYLAHQRCMGKMVEMEQRFERAMQDVELMLHTLENKYEREKNAGRWNPE